MTSAALSAFNMAAGVSPDKMRFFIRSVLLALTFIWAGWCIYGEVRHLQRHDIEEDAFISKIFRILVMVSFMVILVCI